MSVDWKRKTVFCLSAPFFHPLRASTSIRFAGSFVQEFGTNHGHQTQDVVLFPSPRHMLRLDYVYSLFIKYIADPIIQHNRNYVE